MAEPSVLAIIPARGGSKRLPNKNLLELAGKPLVAWSIEAALASGVCSDVIVTSDSRDVLDLAEALGAKARERPAELATDTSPTIDAVIDAIDHLQNPGHGHDVALLLQPTSPLRTAHDISSAYAQFRTHPEASLVSVCEIGHPIEWTGTIDSQGHLLGLDIQPGRRSQDYPPRYRLNGAIYFAPIPTLRAARTFLGPGLRAYVMPRLRSLDIDTAADFAICEALLARENRPGSTR